MKPYIVSHMMESVDGRIDCAMTEQIDPTDSYYEALARLTALERVGEGTVWLRYALADK